MEILKRKFNIGIGKETVRGTKVVPAIWLKPTAEDYNDDVEVVATERSMGVIEDSDDQVVVKNFSSGTFAGEVFDKSFGYILLGAIGQVASVEKVGDSGVYDHTFSVLQSAQHPSMTIEIKRGDIEQKAYANAVVESLKISSAVNEYVVFEVAMRGKKGVAGTATPSYVAENYFLAKNIAVKLADSYAGLSGASAIDVKSIELNISKNIEDKDLLSNDGPADFLNKQMVIEGTIEMYFADVYARDYALNGDTKAMQIVMENTGVTIGSSSHPKLVINLAKAKFSSAPIKGGNNDLAMVELSFKGLYSLSDSKSIEAILTNLQSAY